jgi:hypothetical protein
MSQLLPLLFNYDDLMQTLESSDLIGREKLTNIIDHKQSDRLSHVLNLIIDNKNNINKQFMLVFG